MLMVLSPFSQRIHLPRYCTVAVHHVMGYPVARPRSFFRASTPHRITTSRYGLSEPRGQHICTALTLESCTISQSLSYRSSSVRLFNSPPAPSSTLLTTSTFLQPSFSTFTNLNFTERPT